MSMSDIHDSLSADDIVTVRGVVALLTDDQIMCVRSLSDEWQDTDYNRVVADLMVATSSVFFPDRFDPLVETRTHPLLNNGNNNQHRLLPLGVKVKTYLAAMSW